MLRRTFLILVCCFALGSTLLAQKPKTFKSEFGHVCTIYPANSTPIPPLFRSIYRPANRMFRRVVGLPVFVCQLRNLFAHVTSLSLSETEFITVAGRENIIKVYVFTESADPEGDVLTFNYKVSAGKIIGQGAKVTWDLTGAPPGTYTITAGVNDGAGVCGDIKTRRFEILECAGCGLRETE